jgi:hypothetical protein
LRPSCVKTNHDAPPLDDNAKALCFGLEVRADSARNSIDDMWKKVIQHEGDVMPAFAARANALSLRLWH